MNDEKWTFFAPFLERARERSSRPASDHRLIFIGVFLIARKRAPWLDLHEHFGKWGSVYQQFRRWTVAGIWDFILEALKDSGDGQDTVQMIGSTTVRAHQHAAGAKKGH